MKQDFCHDPCPLCRSQGARLYHQDANKRSQRPYYQCIECHLVFVPSAFYLTASQEKAEYDLHDNQLNDDGYRQFLLRFLNPFKGALPLDAKVLEFGCGPGPALSSMMADLGYDVSLFDHFYYPDKTVFKPAYYDGISSTEVIEHVHDPKAVIESLLSLLKPNGVLGLMTKLVQGPDAFVRWHYKNDLTHVCFYSKSTFQWLAQRYGLTLSFHGADVMLLVKQG